MLRSWVVRTNRRSSVSRQFVSSLRRSFATGVEQRDEPLRILFCGSENFSIAALEALRKYQNDPSSNIISIDVATRVDKPSGRGMKDLRPPPIKRTAAQLGLRLHQFDTFTGWHLPEFPAAKQPYINLIIAVSFGLLVPPRILNSAKFGGLNVHPSMLPELRGAAPINWAILDGHTHTGISIQTLHPSKFDHGVILDQTPEPGIAIPDPNRITAHELRLLLAPIGAEMLINALRSKLYLQPYSGKTSGRQASRAPKVVPSMKIFNPQEDNMTTILRKNRALPRLWTEAVSVRNGEESTKRVLLGPSMRKANMEELPAGETQGIVDNMPVGLPFALLKSKEDVSLSSDPIFVKTAGNGLLVVPEILVAGATQKPAAAAAAHGKLFAEPISHGSLKLYTFHQPLIAPVSNTQVTDKPINNPESTTIRRV